MPAPNRSAWAFMLLALGLMAAVFLPVSVGVCLGPLGVTAIQCAQATGILPTVGAGTPVLAGTVLVAAIVGLPGLLAPMARGILAMVIGAALGTVAYLTLRPTSWTDSTSTGEIITLALPMDPGAVATAAILGGAVGAITAWVFGRVRLSIHRADPDPA